jgi:hypothetical protein
MYKFAKADLEMAVYFRKPKDEHLNCRHAHAHCGLGGEVTLTVDDGKVRVPARNLQDFLHGELPYRNIDVVAIAAPVG